MPDLTKRKVLHVGCGPANPAALHAMFRTSQWDEIRLDIDPKVKPDLIGSITDMPDVPDKSMDAIYSQHNIEHLYPHELPLALGEFLRVLKYGGFALINVPDLKKASEMIANECLEETAYMSAGGAIRPRDMLYSYEKFVKDENVFMLHKMGYTPRSLAEHLHKAGFRSGQTWSENWGLWAIAYKTS
jgi:ubiquinone/menaquinone biosynthesis C-methylase UbiE